MGVVSGASWAAGGPLNGSLLFGAFGQVEVQRAADYAGEEADVTLKLHRTLWPQLEAAPRLETLYDTIEQPLSPVLYRMERAGVLGDRYGRRFTYQVNLLVIGVTSLAAAKTPCSL